MAVIDDLRAENERLHKIIQGLMKEKYRYRKVNACCGNCTHAALGKCEFVDGYVDSDCICDAFVSKAAEIEKLQEGTKKKKQQEKEGDMEALQAYLNRPKE